MQNNTVAAILFAFVGSGLISYVVVTNSPLKDCAPASTTSIVSSAHTPLKPTLIDYATKLKSSQDELDSGHNYTETRSKIASLPPVYLPKLSEPYTLPPAPLPRLPAYAAPKYDVFAGQLEKIRVTNVLGTEQNMTIRAVSDNGYMKEAVLTGHVDGYEQNTDTLVIEFTSFSHKNRSHSIIARAVAKRDQVKTLANLTNDDTSKHFTVNIIFLNQFNFRKIYSANYDGY